MEPPAPSHIPLVPPRRLLLPNAPLLRSTLEHNYSFIYRQSIFSSLLRSGGFLLPSIARCLSWVTSPNHPLKAWNHIKRHVCMDACALCVRRVWCANAVELQTRAQERTQHVPTHTHTDTLLSFHTGYCALDQSSEPLWA